ncbi:hypothetical protein FDZ71_00315, partial [bacterium]
PPPPQPTISSEPPKPEPIKLGATLTAIATRTQGASFAIFQEGNQSNVVAVGGAVSPGVTLKEIQKDFVIVTLNGQDQKIELFAQKPVSGPGAAPQKPTGARGRPFLGSGPGAAQGQADAAAPQAGAGSETIRQVSENSWVIDRREFDDAVANKEALMTQIRVAPNLSSDGQADGFKLFSIRPASIFARIGLQNNDVLKEINGITLNGIDQALEAFVRLQGESSIQVNLIRRGQPQTLNFDIR